MKPTQARAKSDADAAAWVDTNPDTNTDTNIETKERLPCR